MTITLGGIVLDEHLLLHGIETADDISTSTVVTLGGISDTTVMPLNVGIRLSLVALHDGSLRGRFFRSQVLAIKALAAQGVEQTLVHYMGTFRVLIVSTAGLVPFRHCRNPQDTDVYTGPVEMIGWRII